MSQTAATENNPSTNPIIAKFRDGVKTAVVKGEFEIPSLPHVATEVVKIMNNPNVGLNQIEQIIKQDQAMVARIIKTANSALYRGAMEISSLQQAMARIGLGNVKDIVVTLGIQSNAFRVPGYDDVLALIWEQSISAAFIAQKLAGTFFGDKDAAFLTGLLSQIGKPVLVQVSSKLEKLEMNLAKKDAATKGISFDEKAFSVSGLKTEILPLAFNEFHTVVGSAVAARWNLPESVVNVVKFQKDPSKAPEASRKLCWMIHLSLAGSQQLGFGGHLVDRFFSAQNALTALELDAAEYKNLLDDSLPKIQEQLSSFKAN